MRLKTKLVGGSVIVAGAAVLTAINAPKEHQKDLDFRDTLEPAMHAVMMDTTGQAPLNLAGFEINTDDLFLDANNPSDLADEIIKNEGYTIEDPHSAQAYALAACAVNAATNKSAAEGGLANVEEVPAAARAQYQASDFVAAGNTCLSTMVTGITNGTITEISAPVDLLANQ